MRLGLPISAASAISLSSRTPNSCINLIHSHVRNCPTKVAQIRKPTSLFRSNSAINESAWLVFAERMALANWRLLWAVAWTSGAISLAVSGFVFP